MKPSLLMMIKPWQAAPLLKQRPAWGWALALVCGAGLLISLALSAEATSTVLALLPPGASEADKALVVHEFQQEALLRLAFLPVRIVLGVATFALFVFALCRSLSSAKVFRFTHIFSAVIALELILKASDALSAVGLLAGLSIPPWIVPSPLATSQTSLFTQALAAHLTLPTVWYAVGLAFVLHTLCEFPWPKAVLTTGLALGGWLALETTFLVAVSRAYGLLPS